MTSRRSRRRGGNPRGEINLFVYLLVKELVRAPGEKRNARWISGGAGGELIIIQSQTRSSTVYE